MGYLNRENETKEVMTDDMEWLKTGDRAMTDEKGFLVLTCYPADLITLFSGEEVEPSRLEDRVRRELGCVAHCLVVGQARENLAVLLSLDTEVESGGLPTSRLTPQCQQWFRAARFEVKTIAEVLDAVDLGIKHVIQAGIDRTNLDADEASHYITNWEMERRWNLPDLKIVFAGSLVVLPTAWWLVRPGRTWPSCSLSTPRWSLGDFLLRGSPLSVNSGSVPQGLR